MSAGRETPPRTSGTEGRVGGRAGAADLPGCDRPEAGPGGWEVLRDGVEGRRHHQVYLRWEPEARNQLWETDHKQMDIEVLFPRTAKPRQPWTTMFLDGFSQAVMGWAIFDYPSSASVLATFGDAVRVDDSRGPFGGLPATLRPDGGLEFAAEVINNTCGVLGVQLLPTPPYSPNLKGEIERLHASMVTGLLAELPHFTGGPRGPRPESCGATGCRFSVSPSWWNASTGG